MNNNRESLLTKIRALLAKTEENGCTEAESMAALDKARALMDAAEITAEDLQLTKKEKAILRSEPPGTKDAHKIKAYIANAVARFADCRVWRAKGGGLTFCGLASDAQFATWLLDHLAAFVQRELVKHLMGSLAPSGDRKLMIAGFVAGCTSRVSRRLDALCHQSRQNVTSNGRALIVLKSTAVAEKMKELGIHIRSRSSRGGAMNRDSFEAGRSAGDRASFSRPIRPGGNAQLRLTSR
jgi:hypothetical protein